MPTAGPGAAFLLNAISFLAVIGVLWVVRPLPSDRRPVKDEGVIAGFRTALGYMRRRTGILVSVICAVLVAFFGNPIAQFTVVFADQVYNAGPRVVGVLAAAIGTGAVLIAPLLSSWDNKIPRSVAVRVGLPAYAVAVIGFGLAPNWPLGLLALLAVGAGFLAVIATTNTAVQLIVADEMRGRVMSARVMSFTLAFPLGSLVQGYLADLIGPQVTVVGSGVCLLVVALYLASKPSILQTLDNADDTPDRLV